MRVMAKCWPPGSAACRLCPPGAGQAPRVVTTDGPDGYAGELDYLVDCVSKRRAPRIITASDGVTALEICEAEETSIRSGLTAKL